MAYPRQSVKRLWLKKTVHFTRHTPTITTPTIEPQAVDSAVIYAPHGFGILTAGYNFSEPGYGRMMSSFPIINALDTSGVGNTADMSAPDGWQWQWEQYAETGYLQLHLLVEQRDIETIEIQTEDYYINE